MFQVSGSARSGVERPKSWVGVRKVLLFPCLRVEPLKPWMSRTGGRARGGEEAGGWDDELPMSERAER